MGLSIIPAPFLTRYESKKIQSFLLKSSQERKLTALNEYLMHLRARHLSGETGGIIAICSTHRMVLEAAIDRAATEGDVLLVEATSNQVNQFGGYTGMRPSEFTDYIQSLAAAAGFPATHLIIGADHLGPHPWKKMPAAQAMKRATVLVKDCVKAGFNKIHLDTGMSCADDPKTPLPLNIIVERSTMLCLAAESQARRQPADRPLPVYVIGAEVPMPGGGLEDSSQLTVTSAEEVAHLLETTRACFLREGLMSAWERVVAVVVQPGVDFGNTQVARYRPKLAAELSSYHAVLPGMMTYEVHATDYQPPRAIKQLIMDHFTILKVGPCLTNAYREAVYALALIEMEWLGGKKGAILSGIRRTLESAMESQPEHWQTHYRGSATQVDFMRQYSYLDRIRYYWHSPEVVDAMRCLLSNLNRPIPHVLLRQYFPDIYPAIETGEIDPTALSLIKWRIRRTLTPFNRACRHSAA